MKTNNYSRTKTREIKQKMATQLEKTIPCNSYEVSRGVYKDLILKQTNILNPSNKQKTNHNPYSSRKS